MAKALFIFLFLAVNVLAQTADPMPYETLKTAIQIIQSAKPASRQSNERFVIDKVRQQRLDFPVTEQIVSDMKRAGASDELIRAARESSLNIDDLLNSARRDLQAGRPQQALAAAQKAADWQASAEVWRLIAACKVKLGDSAGAYDAYSKQIAAGGELTGRRGLERRHSNRALERFPAHARSPDLDRLRTGRIRLAVSSLSVGGAGQRLPRYL